MHIGLIGYGAIATSLIAHLPDLGVDRATILVRQGSEAAAKAKAAKAPAELKLGIVTSLEALLDSGPGVLVECAGHEAVATHGPAVLAAGVDLIIASVGALADPTLHDTLLAASRTDGAGRMILPIGAIGGLDLLTTLAQAGHVDVTYQGTKPPAAWKGSAAETVVDLDALDAPASVFSGNAREAARAFPKNANVVAALALSGAGFERTHVELVADPQATGNTHAYTVDSPLCHYRIDITAHPSPDNPRTSATTAWSILAEVRRALALSRPR